MTEVLVTGVPALEAFANAEVLTAAAANAMAEQITDGVAARGQAGIALAGGTTPADLYRRLADRELPWERVAVTLTDERWVGAESPDSNERMIRVILLSGRGAAARFLPLKEKGETPEAGAEAATTALSSAPWPLDVVLLGMGEDAHFASLFPGNPALRAGLDPAAPRCIAVPAGSPAPPQPRLSLSLPAILDSRLILLLIRGEAKRAVIQRALAGDDIYEKPIRAVLRQSQTPVRVLWAP